MDERPGGLPQDAISTVTIAVTAMSLGSIFTGDELRTKDDRETYLLALTNLLSIWPYRYDKQL